MGASRSSQLQEARQLCQVGGGLGLKKLKGLRIESSAWVLTAECSFMPEQQRTFHGRGPEEMRDKEAETTSLRKPNPKDLETKTKLGDLIERTNPLM